MTRAATAPFPPELSALVVLLRQARGRAVSEEAREALSKVGDWPWFVSLACQHGILSALPPDLFSASPDALGQAMPETARASLSEKRRRQTFRALHQIAALRRLAGIMSKADIPVLAFKGPLLSQALFNDPTHRAGTDLDVLVGDTHVPAADRCLRANGYQRILPARPLSPLQTRLFMARDCAMTYMRDGVSIDLHWRLFENPHLLDVPFEQLRAGSRDQSAAGAPLHHPDGPDLLLYLALHAAKHQWLSLKWLEDSAAFVETHPPEVLEHAIARARRSGVAPALLATLDLAERLVGGPAAPPSTDAGEKRHRCSLVAMGLRTLATAGDRKNNANPVFAAQIFLQQGALKRSVRYRIRALLRWLINPKDWDAIPLPPFLFPLYLVLRPVLWVYNRLRHWREGRRHPPGPISKP